MKNIYSLFHSILFIFIPSFIHAQDCESLELISELIGAGSNENEYSLGEEVELALLYSAPSFLSVESVQWEVPSGALCFLDCFQNSFIALDTTTVETTITFDNGCSLTNSLTINVTNPRRVYVPNVFSPNSDGVNDFFSIYADEETVEVIEEFKIFSRKGHMVHEFYYFEPNEPIFGWNGIFDGEELDKEVYAWYAVVRYINGETELFKGDVLLLR